MSVEDTRSAAEKLADPMWRLNNLYKIIDKNARVIQFKPNVAQEKLLRELHTRNVIPKARQRGMSTVIQLLMLDSALFTSNFKGKVVAQDLDAVQEIFRDKLKFAYENLPEDIRKAIPTTRVTTTEMCFGNGSSVAVTTSARSGTVQMLHVSEFGKIAAKYPEKAREVLTGSIPAVPPDGIIFIESTPEGTDGEFYEMVMTARKLQDARVKLTKLDFKVHFFSWWDAPEYQLSPENVLITATDHAYFDAVEAQVGAAISAERRAWYVKTREGIGSDAKQKMKQEYPSTLDECFQASTEGCYYAEHMRKVRSEGRITKVPHYPAYAVHSFWDIGGGRKDATAVWLAQFIGGRINVIGFKEGYGEPFKTFVDWMKSKGYSWEKHFLPHDATHPRQLGLRNKTAEEMIQDLAPGWVTQIVPRIPEVIQGINQTRDTLPRVWFDEEECKVGINHLDNYKKEWDTRNGCWRATPQHDEHSHSSDAFRQLGQAAASGMIHGARDLPAIKIVKKVRRYA